MSKRNLRARRLAKAKPVKETKETKETKEEFAPIVQLDAKSLGVIDAFLSVDHAVKKLELNRPNLLRALKNKTKYKGFLWDFE